MTTAPASMQIVINRLLRSLCITKGPPLVERRAHRQVLFLSDRPDARKNARTRPMGRSAVARQRHALSRTERISSNALLNALEVGPDPVSRQKVAKRPRSERTVRRRGPFSTASGFQR